MYNVCHLCMGIICRCCNETCTIPYSVIETVCVLEYCTVQYSMAAAYSSIHSKLWKRSDNNSRAKQLCTGIATMSDDPCCKRVDTAGSVQQWNFIFTLCLRLSFHTINSPKWPRLTPTRALSILSRRNEPQAEMPLSLVMMSQPSWVLLQALHGTLAR